ncbi:MAG TPA: HlyD family efflux transporter periplasmic adaptor subunit, partial [Tepidisphaeraceae bacterium]|nr:HlyD family efflux transporter periplasmic adaptor subunit [Tepidisphaeraceae bacterium]
KRIGELDKSINESRTRLLEAAKGLEDARRAMDDQLFIEDEQRKVLEGRLGDARDSSDTAKRILDNFLLQKKIFRQYEYPQQFDAKREAFINAELDVKKAETTAARENTQKEAELAKVREKISRLDRNIATTKDNISKCTILAPCDGLIVYGDPNSNIYYGERLAVGASWYGGNAMMNIPDLSAFEVDLGIPEEYRGRVQEAAPVNISLDAVPDLTIAGKLKSIARVTQTDNYYDDGSSGRKFKSVVSLDSTDTRLISGMSARVEIIADAVENALCIPVDGVFNVGGSPSVFVKESGRLTPRRVKPGKRNDSFVQIVEGLTDGEAISLIAPPDFQNNATTQPAQKL